MVDSVSLRLVNVGQGVTKVAAATPAAAPQAPVQTPTPTPAPAQSAAAQLSGTAAELSSAPPVDFERVARIKKAIEDGSFPILPATIADQLLALRLNWVSHDPS